MAQLPEAICGGEPCRSRPNDDNPLLLRHGELLCSLHARLACGEESTNGIIERWHEAATFTRERTVARTTRRATELVAGACLYKIRIEAGVFRGDAGEVGPSYCPIIRQVPNATLAVDQEIERGIDQI